MKKNYYFIATPVLFIALILSGIGGYRAWVESTYQTAEADIYLEDALKSFTNTMRNMTVVIDSINNIDSITTDHSATGDGVLTEEQNAKIRNEINNAKTGLSNANAELAKYSSQLNSGDLYKYKLKEEYQTYLTKLRAAAESASGLLKIAETATANMEKISNSYAFSNEAAKIPKPDPYASPFDYYYQTIQSVEAWKKSHAVDDDLVNQGVLSKDYYNANQFYVGCNNKIAQYANALGAGDFGNADNLFSEYEAQCKGPAEQAKATISSIWKKDLKQYFAQIESSLDSGINAAEGAQTQAQSFHDEKFSKA